MNKKLTSFLILIFTLFSSTTVFSGVYLNPVPNSVYVNINTNILIGLRTQLSSKSLNASSIQVTGSKSGLHTGPFRISENGKKIIFKPTVPFQCNETVTVRFGSALRRLTEIEGYSFHTQKQVLDIESYATVLNQREHLYNRNPDPGIQYKGEAPDINVSVYNNPAPGKIFMSNFPFNTAIPNTPYMIIAENSGQPYFLRRSTGPAQDFKKQPNGNLTYFLRTKFYEMDINYNVIDSFSCGNGYSTDVHELRILDNGHALLMSYDPQIIDMSQIVTGGNTAAIVVGLIIQELDENKEVIFQWRSWEQIPITDALHENLLDTLIDYVHGNAIDMDFDGNLLISSRHLDEITKIDRNEGDIIWRLGGIQNEFNFVNDPDRFTYQHAIRRLPNGNVTLFDNGNFHTPPYSRAIEYSLDEVNKTATLVWQYRNSPDIFAVAMGFAQRLDNGNTLISWGGTNPTVTEVTPEGQIALELSLPQGVYSYRAFKFDWSGPSFIDPQAGYFPAAYKLRQNFPNPFNPVTTFSFDIPEPGMVNLTVYDLLGKQVAVVFNQEMKARTYNVDFDATNLAAGVYFYTLRSDSFVESKKMVLVK